MHNSDLAEDVVQDCFAYLWENRERLLNIENVDYYMYTSVKNKSINTLKRNYKFDAEYDVHKMNLDNSQVPSAHDLMELKDLEAVLEKALQELPERCRTIFVLSRFDGMSNKKIASFLNISTKTVENQMTIALKRLRISVSEKCNIPFSILFQLFYKKIHISFGG